MNNIIKSNYCLVCLTSFYLSQIYIPLKITGSHLLDFCALNVPDFFHSVMYFPSKFSTVLFLCSSNNLPRMIFHQLDLFSVQYQAILYQYIQLFTLRNFKLLTAKLSTIFTQIYPSMNQVGFTWVPKWQDHSFPWKSSPFDFLNSYSTSQVI